VEETFNQMQQALQRYQAASAIYQVLGDEEQVRRLQQNLDKLQQ
jgi:ribosomal protein L20A (L18A)